MTVGWLTKQVIDGRGPGASGAIVEQREDEQWVFKITKYSQSLLDALDYARPAWAPDKVAGLKCSATGSYASRACPVRLRARTAPEPQPVRETELKIFTTPGMTRCRRQFMANRAGSNHPLARPRLSKNPKLGGVQRGGPSVTATPRQINIRHAGEALGFEATGTNQKRSIPFERKPEAAVYVAQFRAEE